MFAFLNILSHCWRRG